MKRRLAFIKNAFTIAQSCPRKLTFINLTAIIAIAVWMGGCAFEKLSIDNFRMDPKGSSSNMPIVVP